MEIVKKFELNDAQVSFMQNLVEKYNNYYNIYIVLGWLANKIIENGNKNIKWVDNEFTNFFKNIILKDKNNFIKDEYMKGRHFPLIPEILIHARLFSLNQTNFVKTSEIVDTDILMAHYLILIMDHKIDKEKINLPFDSEIDYRIALHIEPIAIPDDPKYEVSYETLQICNYFFHNNEKEFSHIVYCASLLMSLAEKDTCIEKKIIDDLKLLVEAEVLDGTELSFANYWKYLFVLKDGKIYFPLGKLSLLFAEQYVKSSIIKREIDNGRDPNIIISKLWTKRKEFMLERLILKNKSTRSLKIYSENSIKKRQSIFADKTVHDWMGKNAKFTPDIMIDADNIWYIFDLKIIHLDSKYFALDNNSYWNKVREHVKSVRKLMNLMKDKRGDVKIKYFVSNALVHSGVIFGKVFVEDINDKFQQEHNRPIPKWIDLHYISLKRLEQWFASKEIKLEQLTTFDSYLQYMIPAADLMTDEMDEFYNSKLDKRLLYDEFIKNNE